MELRRRSADHLARDGLLAEDEQFFAEQNARLVVSAEAYYREIFGQRVNTWNLRDRHMADTLDALLVHNERRGDRARAVVWAHNSHVGDARATERSEQNELNIGQLARERWGAEAVLVGFSTFSGSVVAAGDWGAPFQRMWVRPALHESVEALLHASGQGRLLLPLWEPELRQALDAPRLQRAIGVVYRPNTERVSHYFHCVLPAQFDALVHVDATRALDPLDRSSEWEEDGPGTWPTGT